MVVPKDIDLTMTTPEVRTDYTGDPCPIPGYARWSDFFLRFLVNIPQFLRVKYDSRELVDLQERVTNNIFEEIKRTLRDDMTIIDTATLKGYAATHWLKALDEHAKLREDEYYRMYDRLNDWNWTWTHY